MAKSESYYTFDRYSIPEYMREGICLYIGQGVEPGGFLRAVFENDLVNAVGRADSTNIHNIPAYAAFLYNYAPSDCWGSPAKVETWMRTKKEQSNGRS